MLLGNMGNAEVFHYRRAASFAELIGSEWADVSAGSAREGNQELVIVSAGSEPKSGNP